LIPFNAFNAASVKIFNGKLCDNNDKYDFVWIQNDTDLKTYTELHDKHKIVTRTGVLLQENLYKDNDKLKAVEKTSIYGI
jgi:hypothetical protein